MKDNFKSGFAAIIGRPNVGKFHTDEPPYRTEDRYYVKEAPDYQKPYPDSLYLRGRTDCVPGYAGNP